MFLVAIGLAGTSAHADAFVPFQEGLSSHEADDRGMAAIVRPADANESGVMQLWSRSPLTPGDGLESDDGLSTLMLSVQHVTWEDLSLPDSSSGASYPRLVGLDGTLTFGVNPSVGLGHAGELHRIPAPYSLQHLELSLRDAPASRLADQNTASASSNGFAGWRIDAIAPSTGKRFAAFRLDGVSTKYLENGDGVI
ncbi:MAG: hypothetical protein ACPGXK_11015, partial [Phycisphaerae bacterium]